MKRNEFIIGEKVSKSCLVQTGLVNKKKKKEKKIADLKA